MNSKSLRMILQGLLERLDADATSDSPRFTSFVSSVEREAIRTLLQEGNTAVESSAATSQPDEARIVIPLTAKNSAPSAPAKPSVSLNLRALDSRSEEDYVVCLDFGTAKSKAFAGSVEDADDEDPDPDMLELGLGKLDSDLDRAVYSVASSIWISESGAVFAGSRALVESAKGGSGNSLRRRLDSIKQELSLSNVEQNLADRILDPEINPTGVSLSYEDALCFYLAYLTDLTGTELERQNHSRYTKRRFTLPAWRQSQRRWASVCLAETLKRAQILADTFHGRWQEGIPVEELKQASEKSREYSNRLNHLLDDMGGASGVGILEPLAAGSGRIWADKNARNLVLVVDVGAGTTDFSMFWVVQDAASVSRKAFPVQPGSDALRMAGDLVDDILIRTILEKVHGQPNESVRRRIEADLRLRGLRQSKEQLFRNGRISVPLVTDQVVELDRDEFVSCAAIQNFSGEIRRKLSEFVCRIDSSWLKAAGRATLVLTGGSSHLPFIQSLSSDRWDFGGAAVSFTPALPVPELISRTFDDDFQREYPQLAVALGGVLPVMDEKGALSEWHGGAAKPGQLEGYYSKADK